MKNINFLIGFLLFICTNFCVAQVSIVEQEMNMNMGIKNAIVLELPDSDIKLVEKLWKKYIKQFGGKTKKVKKSNEWMTDNATISTISTDWVDMYSSFEKSGNNAVLNLWVDMGEDEFINSYAHASQYEELENILLHFSEEVRKANVELEMAEEEKTLKRLETELKKLERLNDNYHKEIENAKAKIAKAEENIITNESDQEQARDLILQQQNRVEEVRQKMKGN